MIIRSQIRFDKRNSIKSGYWTNKFNNTNVWDNLVKIFTINERDDIIKVIMSR